jgi:hypothetical protein
MRKAILLIVILLLVVMAGSAIVFWVASASPKIFASILSALFGSKASAGGGGEEGGYLQHGTLIVSACTFGVSAVSAVFTVLFGWRKDWREAKEFKLRLVQLELQIAELRSKIPSAAT